MNKQTPLYDCHLALGAKMGDFAGYDMPLYYKAGVLREHEWTRSHAGVFDVSHMGQVIIEGPGAAAFLEKITPSSFLTKKTGRAQYTVLTNEKGGIIDDLIVSRLGEERFFAVVNAGCKDKDMQWLKSQASGDVTIYPLQDQALVAVQGNWAERIIHETFGYDAHDLPYMHTVEAQTPYGLPLIISRLGYTGEDGFEISMPAEIAAEIWISLIGHPEALPVGLAARDSLRLEMGYPLYGHDIDVTTSPVEAGLEWIIRKENRNFIGADRIIAELATGTQRLRVGLKLIESGIAREGAEICDETQQPVGVLTSGGFSPTLKHGIGQGYIVPSAFSPGGILNVKVRDRFIKAQIVTMPFVPPKTRTAKKTPAQI